MIYVNLYPIYSLQILNKGKWYIPENSKAASNARWKMYIIILHQFDLWAGWLVGNRPHKWQKGSTKGDSLPHMPDPMLGLGCGASKFFFYYSLLTPIESCTILVLILSSWAGLNAPLKR